MKKLPPLQVKVDRVKPLIYGDSYESRMILDHVITGRDNVIQINHGTVKAHKALGGAAHEEDEIYYILDGKGKLKLDDEIIDIEGNQVRAAYNYAKLLPERVKMMQWYADYIDQLRLI